VAFIIVAAGPMTASRRLRTCAAGRVMAWGVWVCAVLMGGGIALGYGLGVALRLEVVDLAPDVSDVSDERARPASQVVVDRLGNLSGRLTRLEIEAAELARRFGGTPSRNAPPPDARRPATSPAADSPQGGPWLPVDSDGSADAAGLDSDGYGDRLADLENGVERLEASLAQLAGIAADRDLATMAYPNRLPVLERMPRISSGFGVRRDPFTGRMARHMGLDIPAPYGTPVLASGGGRVISAGFRGPYGKAIVIDHGRGLQTVYGHCSKLYVRRGDLVMPQQKIAAVGSTGRSTGPHLHFEVIRDGARVEPGQVLATVLARNTT
jgi:murein DD-endopeptidase MepM/ murein hydrolase activator NlpD